MESAYSVEKILISPMYDNKWLATGEPAADLETIQKKLLCIGYILGQISIIDCEEEYPYMCVKVLPDQCPQTKQNQPYLYCPEVQYCSGESASDGFNYR